MRVCVLRFVQVDAHILSNVINMAVGSIWMWFFECYLCSFEYFNADK